MGEFVNDGVEGKAVTSAPAAGYRALCDVSRALNPHVWSCDGRRKTT